MVRSTAICLPASPFSSAAEVSMLPACSAFFLEKPRQQRCLWSHSSASALVTGTLRAIVCRILLIMSSIRRSCKAHKESDMDAMGPLRKAKLLLQYIRCFRHSLTHVPWRASRDAHPLCCTDCQAAHVRQPWWQHGRTWLRETRTNTTMKPATNRNQGAGKRKGPRKVPRMLPQVNAGISSL